ncbi:MAG: hypothetical protein P4L82_11870 [Ancalomicrobiaceae bacterium]|nr:hypothetical protein [Ancalomicrobiaceae bacterium]
MLGRLQTECGYTPQQARDTTLAEYLDLCAYWSRNPPPGAMLRVLAMAWGWKPPEPRVPQMSFDEAVEATGEMFKHLDRWFPGVKD